MKKISSIIVAILLVFCISICTYARASLYIQNYIGALNPNEGTFSAAVVAVNSSNVCKVDAYLMECQSDGSWKQVASATNTAKNTQLTTCTGTYAYKSNTYYYLKYTVYVENGGNDTRTSETGLAKKK